MLKVRIIPILLWNGSTLVKGQQFINEKRAAGSPLTTIKIYNSRDVDEIVLFNISNRKFDNTYFDFVREITDCVSVPITIGGGIKDIDEMDQLFMSGADKISINSIIYSNPNIINNASKRFGSQAIVVSIDVRKNQNKYQCFSNNGKKLTNKDFIIWIKECADRGAGEIIVNSINHDGLMEGYDNELIKKASSNVKVPIIAAGGAGNFEHFFQAYNNGANALAASSVFHFTATTPANIKRYLNEKNVPIRHNFKSEL
jgi:cyclase